MSAAATTAAATTDHVASALRERFTRSRNRISSGHRYRGDEVFFGGHSGQTLPDVASIGIGPTSENPGTNPGGCGRGGGGG